MTPVSKTGTQNTVELLLSENPKRAFDIVIGINREEPSQVETDTLKQLVLLSIASIAGSPYSEGDLQRHVISMLEHKENIRYPKPLIAALLRLLPEPGFEWILDAPWRLPVTALFDAYLQDVYRDRKISPQSMAHEKLQNLAEGVSTFEGGFLESLGMLTSLDRANVQRHKLMRALGYRITKDFIVPFLPEAFDALLGEIYKRVEVYLTKREDLGVVDILSTTRQEIELAAKKFEGEGTIYSRWITELIAQKLLTLIDQDFSLNAAAQPADVFIETRDTKKYPLHLPNELVSLGFIVSNRGPGYAYEAKLTILSDESLKLSTDDVMLGRLAPATSQLVEIPATVLNSQPTIDLYTQITWNNFDHSHHIANSMFVAHAQRSDIDWIELEQSDPYSLEPVTTEDDLVGRRDLLNRLLGTLKAPSIGSAIIRGQKRVGKTSIAKTLQSNLQRDNYLAIYLESGDYVEANPNSTVTRLGHRLCKELTSREPRIAHLSHPVFDDALSPLAEFLDDAIRIAPDRRIVFILDEFDELPLDLYSRGALGDSFFLTLRSISSRPSIGFVLVGSEKMTHVMDCQGDKLNKWNVVPVDYFTREADWSDYKELVQRPVADALEYSDGALLSLHELTAGNPYFTKLVCQRVFRAAVKKRDCHITRTEIGQAVEIANRETDRNTFQHFWEDGIFERGPKAAEKSIRRRKILIAISDVLAGQSSASKVAISEHQLARHIASIESDLKEFVTRKVLLTNGTDETYDLKVPLFAKWLKDRGVEDIIATFSDLDAALRERQEEEEMKIHSGELQQLASAWGNYKGQRITEDRVRAWLEQFGRIRDQRLMFRLLTRMHFYSDSFIRQKLAEIHDVVKRHTVHQIEAGRLKRSDIIVSYIDHPAKSSGHLARLYVDEASIYVENVIEKSKLRETLWERKNVQAVLFLEDFVGTGTSATAHLKQVHSAIDEIAVSRGIRIFFGAVVAYIDGRKKLEEMCDTLRPPIHLHFCETLDEADKAFSELSRTFQDPEEREAAKAIAMTYGKLLEKSCPLGFGDLQLAIAFERSCPNNSLPILWSESIPNKWTPLFKRL